MPVRPKTVVIDGIHYRAVDSHDALEMRLEIYKRATRFYKDAFLKMKDEAERLKAAISDHKTALLADLDLEFQQPNPVDYKLWEVIDD